MVVLVDAMDYKSSSSLHLIVLTALCGVLFFVGLGLGRAPFHDRGEPREALAVQDILLRGDGYGVQTTVATGQEAASR